MRSTATAVKLNRWVFSWTSWISSSYLVSNISLRGYRPNLQ